jgi:hypothetical protein
METNKNNYVLVLLMSTACGHCTNFKNTHLSNLKTQLKSNYPNVKLVELSLPTMSSPIPDEYPPSLKQFAKWFPTVLMFTGEEWSAASIEPKQPLTSGYVFNGTFHNGNVDYTPENPMTADAIIQWMNQKISLSNTNPMKVRYQNEVKAKDIKSQNETLLIPTTYCAKIHFKNNDRRC